MRPALLLGALIYALVLAGLATLQGAVLAFALLPLVWLAAALLTRPAAPSLRITRTLSSDRATPGTPVTVQVSVTNTGAALADLLLEDRVPAGLAVAEGTPRLLTALPAGASAEFSYSVSGARGVFQFAGVQVSAREPLGVLGREAFVNAPGQLFILPDVLRLRRLAIRPRQTQIYAGSIPARQGGPGIEFFGVRPYQPGDPTRWVSARATARHPDQLFVNEFEQERVTEVGLIVDVRLSSNVHTLRGALLEHSIQAAAALGTALLDQGNRVGLLLYGNTLNWTYPGYGKLQRERVLRALARAELGDAPVFEDFDRIPTRLFPARSQLILISPLKSRDRDVLRRLHARGYQILVITPNPILFERQAHGPGAALDLAARLANLERATLLADIRRAGITVIDWDVALPFHQLADTALSRPMPQRGRI